MYIECVPNRNSPPAILLRESYRVGKLVKKRTLLNLTKWEPQLIEGLKQLLKGAKFSNSLENLSEKFTITRSLAHGHVLAVLGTIRNIGLDKTISAKPSRKLDLVCAMLIARIIHPGSKLSTAREIHHETVTNSIGTELNLDNVNEDDFYEALDWLLERQEAIQKKFIDQHLNGSYVFLYDASSSYFEGTKCPLAKYGYSRDKKRGKLQIVYGLLCSEDGCPLSIEVFEGNTADPNTFSAQVAKIKESYGIKRLIWVGDRGMITNARVKQDLKVSEQFDWITALRAKEIQALFKLEELKISDFDSQDLLEISSTLYPDERLVACKNQQLAKERDQTREALLLATEVELEQIVSAVKKGKLSKTETIALKVGKVISKFKVQKHFILDIKDKSFIYQRNQEAINKEKTTDGIYVIRISLPATELSTENSVLTYKSLAQVERAFRSLKTVDLKIRPIFHRTENRVRAHVFLCMLAYYVEWHMRQSLSSILFDDNAKELAKIERKSVVAKARRSESAVKKASCKINELGFTAHSFQTLISDLGSIVKNYIQPNISDAPSFVKITQPTPYQEKVFELLSIKL